MPPIKSDFNEVQIAAELCIKLAQRITESYLDIDSKLAIYEDSISKLKNNLIAILSISQINDHLNSIELNDINLELALLDVQSARLKANLTAACSRIMGELGGQLDKVRIGLNSIIINFDKSHDCEEYMHILIFARNEVDDLCRALGKIQFSGIQGMEKIFSTLNIIKTLKTNNKKD